MKKKTKSLGIVPRTLLTAALSGAVPAVVPACADDGNSQPDGPEFSVDAAPPDSRLDAEFSVDAAPPDSRLDAEFSVADAGIPDAPEFSVADAGIPDAPEFSVDAPLPDAARA